MRERVIHILDSTLNHYLTHQVFWKHFGTAQGKSWANLKQLAEAAGVELINFVPPEAETVEDIKGRCISFFNVSNYYKKNWFEYSYLETGKQTFRK